MARWKQEGERRREHSGRGGLVAADVRRGGEQRPRQGSSSPCSSGQKRLAEMLAQTPQHAVGGPEKGWGEKTGPFT